MARILVVEDDPDIRELVTEFLVSAGHAVKTAANGAEALAMVDHHSFELIVLDLMMPVMSGWEFLEARGDDLVAQHVPVAVASAAHEPRSVLDCAAVCELLPKPFDLYELEAMIDRMLAPAPPPEELTA